MQSSELFNKFNRFYLDTHINTIDVFKKDFELVSIIKWKNGNKDTEISKPTEKDIIPWINRNKTMIQFS